MDNEIKNLKEFIHEKFESHEELEALRFKRIDELLSQYGRVCLDQLQKQPKQIRMI